jgi:hypothetical protein
MQDRRQFIAFGLSAAAGALLPPGGACAADAPDAKAQEILAAADKVRNPDVPFRVTNTLVEYHGGQPASKLTLVVYAKEDKGDGQFHNLVRFVDPPADAGKLVLLNGTVMWFYDPAANSTVRISPQQRLIGQASNGDVLTINLNKDYKAHLLGEEKIQDSAHQEHECWHLELSAATETAVYFRCEMWLEKSTSRPIKGKFFADSGRLLKIAYYGKYEEQIGAARPTEAIIIDAVDSSLVTRMTFSDYRAVEIPDAWFQRDFLPRLKAD